MPEKRRARVLVGCELFGRVRDALRARGHDAWSCDVLESEPASRFHLRRDVREVLGWGWDAGIFFPPCTYICSSGLHWNTRRPERAKLTEEGVAFALELWNAPIPRVAMENPIGRLSTRLRKPDQIIHPHQFGHDASKATCLWLRGLPPLHPTEQVLPMYGCRCGYRFDYVLGKYGCPNCAGERGPAREVWGNQTASGQNRLPPSPDRWKLRSATYHGIADAMGDQWGAVL